jgi:hypothetical protein
MSRFKVSNADGFPLSTREYKYGEEFDSNDKTVTDPAVTSGDIKPVSSDAALKAPSNDKPAPPFDPAKVPYDQARAPYDPAKK